MYLLLQLPDELQVQQVTASGLELLHAYPLTNARSLQVALDGTLYFIASGGVWRQQPTAPEPELLLPASGRNWYSLGYDAQRQELYAADAGDYVQLGEVLRLSVASEPELLDAFVVGVIPGSFYFSY